MKNYHCLVFEFRRQSFVATVPPTLNSSPTGMGWRNVREKVTRKKNKGVCGVCVCGGGGGGGGWGEGDGGCVCVCGGGGGGTLNFAYYIG